MTIRCPVCRADNSIAPACRRCKADLSLLWALEARRECHVAAAKSAVEAGRFEQALDELRETEELRAGPDVERLRACVAVLRGDFDAAVRAYVAATAP
ncbi:MAG TPA: hypothetical protein VKE40_15100 [Gemmataceae bacterium]|nr:hypothetical protein [Gemmataceae bacterium]